MLLDTYFYNINYSILFNFIFVSFFLVIVLILISYILSPSTTTFEKYSAYECGFEPFGNSKEILDIQFYIIAVLFLIFDLEIVLLFA
jgi:NADH-quinone oxidoreductase subunit A